MSIIIVIFMLIGLLNINYAQAALRVATGEYVVDDDPTNDDDRNITVTPSFAITAVFIKCNATQVGVWRHTDGGGANTQYVSATSAQISNAIQSIGTGTFQIGTRAEVQPDCGTSCTTTCYYAAFGGDSTEIASGSYTGNGLDNRNVVTGLSFQPGMVMIRARTSEAGTIWRASVMTGDNSTNFAGSSLTANLIQALNSDGFQVGTGIGVNTDTVGYVWLAIKDVANQSASGTHTGTGSDDQAVTIFPDPTFVWFKRNAATSACARWQITGDNSWFFGATAAAANMIQALTSTGVTVGTDACVNTSASTYHWWAARDQIVASVRRNIMLNFGGGLQ